MMMNSVLAFVVLACIWKFGDCTIVFFTPTLTGGVATHPDELNAGLTSGDATGITIVGTTDITGLTHTVTTNTLASPSFTIADATGLLTVATGTVVYSTATTSIVFVVVANDDGGVPATATVTVNINAIPVFGAYRTGEICLTAGLAGGVDVEQMSATDENTADVITFGLVAGTNTGTAFEVNTASGMVQVAAGITLVNPATYNLEVTAEDDSTPGGTATATLSIAVKNVCSNSAITLTLSLMTILTAIIVTKLA